jgi:hypothetical protein
MKFRCPVLWVLIAATAFSVNAATKPSTSAPVLPDWSGWWGAAVTSADDLFKAFDAIMNAPWQPEAAATMRAFAASGPGSSPGDYCQPLRFNGFTGFGDINVEFLFSSGRVTILDEAGRVRRIATDGRRLPTNADTSDMGTSVGHWEAETLVIETVGIAPDTRFPTQAARAPRMGRNVRIVERIALKSRDVLEIELTVTASELLTAPFKTTQRYERQHDHEYSAFSDCVPGDRGYDAASGKQRFDLTPPVDLPPPPQ